MTLDTEARLVDMLDASRIDHRCHLEGRRGRAIGIACAENLYLRPEALPAATGEGQSAWFRKCDAWWRGWDGEDKARAARTAAQNLRDRPLQASGPCKSALMRSLSTREAHLERLRRWNSAAEGRPDFKREVQELLQRT